MPKRELTGKIISDKMDKTVVVRVETKKTHPKYKKIYKSHKNYKAHSPENSFKMGDMVTIRECSPISKDKRWEIVKKVEI